LGNNVANLNLTVSYSPSYTLGNINASDKIYLELGQNAATGTFANVFSVFDVEYNQTFNIARGTDGSYWRVVYQDTTGPTGNDIALYAIPEPSTWAMLLGGFALLAGFQYFRRRRSA